MKKYEVEISLVVSSEYDQTVIVEAENKQQAKELAIKKTESNNWREIHSENEDYKITSIEKID